jgi:phenylalanyl-tRNA synthetase beta chain
MRAPVDWLADYVAIEIPVEELAHRLTMAGIKVEAVERIGADWEDVVVGQVITVEPHPASRKPLTIATVDLGEETITVVTGAPNVREGQKVPVVRVGGLLPHGPDGGPMRIERRPMAGRDSEGMLASERELGISEEHTGIVILPDDAPLGAPLRSAIGGDVLDIETNPNRPDTLSIIGIAREVAAITEQQLTLPDLESIAGRIEWLDRESIPVSIEDPDLCPRYSALRVEGLAHAFSPPHIAARLQAAGMRPINLVVDLTNYVMLEYGQPMHAFDATDLTGDRIVVRRAAEGERIITLDGVERALSRDDLLIADAERAVGIAGVMGGENSEIRESTSAIVLESASFDPISVRRTAKRLGLRTEASARFEKGLPPEATTMGLRRFLQLLAQFSERPLRVYRISDAYPGVPEPRVVSMPLWDAERLLGIPVAADEASDLLSLLGFSVSQRDGTLAVTVPFWRRVDIEQSADLVEEVGRLIGFERIPVTLPLRTMPPQALPEPLRLENVIRERLLAAGVSEAVTHNLTYPAALSRLDVAGGAESRWAEIVPNAAGVYAQEALVTPVSILNPATQDRQMLRLSIVPNLLEVLARNLRHTDERVAFFELGRTIFRCAGGADLPYERRTLALALAGKRRVATWQEPQPGPYTFFDLKGMLESVVGGLHVSGWHVAAAEHPALHPGRSAVLRLGGHNVAYLGELHPEIAARFDLEGERVQVAEVDLDTLFDHAEPIRSYHPLPRFPAAYRDIAVIVDGSVAAERVIETVRLAGDELLESARIFDVYRGKPLAEEKKSIAIGLTFRAPGATLTQDEVNEAMDHIVAALETELEATLRE